MNTTPRKFYDTGCINHGGFRYFRDEDSTTRCSGCNEIISTPDLPASGQHDKKLTPMAAHIEWLKSERNACYELCHDEQMACFDDAINHATSLLVRWMEEYASQQAPAGLYTREQMEKAIEFGFN